MDSWSYTAEQQVVVANILGIVVRLMHAGPPI